MPSDDAIDIAWRLLKTQTNLNQFMPHGVYGDLPAPVFFHGADRGLRDNWGKNFRSRDYANIVREGLDPSSMVPYSPIDGQYPPRRRAWNIGLSGEDSGDLHEWKLDDTGLPTPISADMGVVDEEDDPNVDARHYLNPEFPDKIKQLMLDRHHPKNPQNYAIRHEYWRPEYIGYDEDRNEKYTEEPMKIHGEVTTAKPRYWQRNNWLDFQNPEGHKRNYSRASSRFGTESNPEGRNREWYDYWLNPDFNLEKPEFGWTQSENERYGRRGRTWTGEKGEPKFSLEQSMRLFPELYAHPKWRGVFPKEFNTHGVDHDDTYGFEFSSPSLLSEAGQFRRTNWQGPERPRDDYNARQARAASKLNQSKWHAEHGPKGATFVTRPGRMNEAVHFGEPIGIRPIQGPKSDRGFVMHQPHSFAFDNGIPGEGVLFDAVPPEQLVFGRNLSSGDTARAMVAGREGTSQGEPFDSSYAMGLKPIPEKWADWEPEENEDDYWKGEPMDLAWRLLKSHPLNPKFQYIGTHLSRSGNKRPVGLISYDSTAGHGRRTFPFYQSTGINSDQPGTWFPFHGIDSDGWFIKPNVGMADNGYDSEQGRYGHSRFRMLSDWMVDNPMQEFEETLMGNNEINNALQASETEGLYHTSFDTDVLKRQTELGEFHEDFPSSHGPVTEYHGTIDLPSVLEQGLEGKVMARHRAVKPPADMEGQPVVYTTDDPDAAKRWAESRGRNLKVPSGKVGVIGVRGSNLPSVEQSDPHSQFRGTTRVRTPNIPRENITPFE